MGSGALLGGPSREEGKHDEDGPTLEELVAEPLARQARHDPDHAADDLAAV